MKRIYAIVALLVGSFTTVFAQGPKEIDLGVRPLFGPYDNAAPGDTVTISWEITNNGPDSLSLTDTTRFLIDTRIFGADIADVQDYVFLNTPPLSILAGGKDTLYLRLIEGDIFFSGEDALIDFASDATQCTWASIYGYDGDSSYYFIDPGFDGAAFNSATDGATLKAAFTGNNRGEENVVFGTGADMSLGCALGISEVEYEKQTLNIYPNPASDVVNFAYDFTVSANATVKVADLSGRVVLVKDFGKQAGSKTLSLDVSGLTNGMYFVELTSDNKKAISKLTIRK